MNFCEMGKIQFEIWLNTRRKIGQKTERRRGVQRREVGVVEFKSIINRWALKQSIH